jgi:hypothetical protein
MREDADTAQARQLLHFLYAHVDEISQKLEAAEDRCRQENGRNQSRVRREAAILRRDLYEAHRLIDGLHRRFPATRPPSRWAAHPPRSIGTSARQFR